MLLTFWIPAARPDVINEQNLDRLQPKLTLQKQSFRFTHTAEKILHQRSG